MRKDKEIATELRKSGKSYREIHKALKIPLGTLSDWFGGLEWSKEMQKKLASSIQVEHTARLLELDKIRGQHLARAYDEAKMEAREELSLYKYNPLFIAGMMLYWAEGDKVGKTAVRVTSTNGELLRLYFLFLTQVCRIPISRVKGHISFYPEIDERLCKVYWAKKIGLSEANFTKSSQILGVRKVNRLSWGICTIVISSAYFKAKIMEWIKLLPKELMNKEYYESM